MTDSTTMTVRLSRELKGKLERLAESTRRSKSYLAAEAIAEYVEPMRGRSRRSARRSRRPMPAVRS